MLLCLHVNKQEFNYIIIIIIIHCYYCLHEIYVINSYFVVESASPNVISHPGLSKILYWELIIKIVLGEFNFVLDWFTVNSALQCSEVNFVDFFRNGLTCSMMTCSFIWRIFRWLTNQDTNISVSVQCTARSEINFQVTVHLILYYWLI